MMYAYGYGPSFGLMHLFSWIIWIVVIVFVIKFIRSKSWKNNSFFGGDNALNLLKERYAKGEISKEEYEERKKVLLG